MRDRLAHATSYIRLGAFVLAAVYAVLFIAFNTHRAKIDFVFAATRVSLIFLVLLSLAIGFVLGVLVTRLRRHRQDRG